MYEPWELPTAGPRGVGTQCLLTPTSATRQGSELGRRSLVSRPGLARCQAFGQLTGSLWGHRRSAVSVRPTHESGEDPGSYPGRCSPDGPCVWFLEFRKLTPLGAYPMPGPVP